MDTRKLETLTTVRVLCRSGKARTLRQAAGVSTREVAKALGVAPATVVRWETARCMPKKAALDYAAVLATWLDL